MQLVFHRVVRDVLSIAVCVAVCACGEARDPRHLVLVTIDTLRADRLGVYGHDVPTSPHFDRLALDGVLFEQAIAQSISTPPSHASILTGLNPPRHGLRRLSGQALAPGNVTLAEWLGQRGFRTTAFVSALPLRRDLGLHQGFRDYDDEFDRQRSARETNARVREWLTRRGDERLFIWVHYFDPHWPYLPPAEEQRRYARRQVTHRDLHRPVNTRDAAGSVPSSKTTALMGALYDGEIAATDAALGELVGMMEDEGIMEDALLAVVADHGECLGEHGYYFGHWDVYPETARVPMLLVHPSGRRRGTVVNGLVATVDLMPTLIAWLGLDVPPDLDGRDLTPLIEDTERSPRVAYTEQLEYFSARAIYTGRWMLRETEQNLSPRSILLDREVDRALDRDVSATHASIKAELGEQLRAILESSDRQEAVTRSVSDETAEGLRALGYVE